ncbi:thioredoxin family protein [uncultured Candidatus Thioglobus sp.]|nr:thioredoxin family protein [uncultured Candidatus Thioglobus sp.]
MEIRVFPAKGNILIIGFACDNGKSKHEEATSESLAEDGIEVWMPDMLGTYMLPKSRSSYNEIPNEDLTHIIYEAISTNKEVYIVASGPDTQLLLKTAAHWKKEYPDYKDLKGAILLFPRLNDGAPEPGVEPKYIESVGSTTIPLMVLEGGRTPNRWGLNHLSAKLASGGSRVISKIVPDIRGYFFNRADPNRTEDIVTSQLSGLIKVSLFYLQESSK